MSGQNKRTHVGGSYQRASILSPFELRDKAADREIKVIIVCMKAQTESCSPFSGYRIAQVQVAFRLSQCVIPEAFLPVDTPPPNYLAYVEWFTHLSATKDPKHGMYRVSRQMEGGQRSARVIPVDPVARSIHLIPRFEPVVAQEWSSFNVLEHCQVFYVNPFVDVHSYLTFV
jgi:hypothetical protein